MNLSTIYGLFDPRDGELRYIGKTTDKLRKRYTAHCNDKIVNHKTNWIKKLKRYGFKPIIKQIQTFEHISPEDLNKAEIYWIKYFKNVGCRLANSTLGGEGSKGLKFSQESKLKASISRKAYLAKNPIPKGEKHHSWGLKLSPEHRANFCKKGKEHPRFGKSLSAESKLKMRKTKCVRPFVNQFGDVYISQREAAQELKLHQAAIQRVLAGKQRVTDGYVFKYLEES